MKTPETPEDDLILWRYRINRKNVYCVIFTAAIITTLGVITTFLISNRSNVCITRECVRASNIILKNLNEIYNPCDGFYNFSCGSYGGNEIFSLEKRVEMQLRDIIEEEPMPGDSKYLNVLKRYYTACKNESLIEKEGLKQIREFLKDIGGWPTVEGFTWRENTYSWISAAHKLRAIGFEFQGIIDISVVLNKKNPLKYILQISPPALKLNNEIDVKMIDIAVAFGAERIEAETEYTKVVEFRNTLLKISGEEPLYQINYITLTRLQQLFSTMPWYEYLNGILYPSAKITYEEEVNVLELDFIAKLETVLRNTSKRYLSIIATKFNSNE